MTKYAYGTCRSYGLKFLLQPGELLVIKSFFVFIDTIQREKIPPVLSNGIMTTCVGKEF